MFLKFSVGGGENIAKVWVHDFYFLEINLPLLKMHVSATIMAADKHVPQFPEGGAGMIFDK